MCFPGKGFDCAGRAEMSPAGQLKSPLIRKLPVSITDYTKTEQSTPVTETIPRNSALKVIMFILHNGKKKTRFKCYRPACWSTMKWISIIF